jgi:hypothetical protein
MFRPQPSEKESLGIVIVELCGQDFYSQESPQSIRLWSPDPRGLRQEFSAGVWNSGTSGFCPPRFQDKIISIARQVDFS